MSKKSSDYEVTTLGQFIIVIVALGILCVFFPLTNGTSQNSSTTETAQNDTTQNNTTQNQRISSQQHPHKNNHHNKKSATQATQTVKKNTTPKKAKTAPKPNPKVIGYKEPRQKSAYVRKHHDIDVVKSTNYSKMAPLKNPQSPSEKWVMDRIKKYSKNLPRILLQDYGDDGYYINTIGQDAVGRYIIPGINPDGEWSTVLYSNTNRQGKRIKMILGHNWRKWKDQGFYIHAIYVSNKTISLRNKAGKNLASSIYPVNQSLSKGPVFRFR